MASITHPIADLNDSDVDALKQGHPIRIPAPALGGDLVILLADASEDTAFVLRDRLKDLTATAEWQQSVEKARTANF